MVLKFEIVIGLLLVIGNAVAVVDYESDDYKAGYYDGAQAYITSTTLAGSGSALGIVLDDLLILAESLQTVGDIDLILGYHAYLLDFQLLTNSKQANITRSLNDHTIEMLGEDYPGINAVLLGS